MSEQFEGILEPKARLDWVLNELEQLRQENTLLREALKEIAAFTLGGVKLRPTHIAEEALNRPVRKVELACEKGAGISRTLCQSHPAVDYKTAWGCPECVRELRVENTLLREALTFYAAPETYHAITFLADSPCGDFARDFGKDHGYAVYERAMPGERARAAFNLAKGHLAPFG